MAKKSSNQLSSFSKWIFLFALAISIPLTLLAVNNISTETRSHAATYTCSSSNTSGTCPSGEKCGYDSNLGMYTCKAITYTCSSSNTSGTCPSGKKCGYNSSSGIYACMTVPAVPTGLDSKSHQCNATVTINFNWNRVSAATGYYLLYVKHVAGVAPDFTKITPKYIPGDNYSVQNSIQNIPATSGKRFDWTVKATNGSVVGRSAPYHITDPPYLACP